MDEKASIDSGLQNIEGIKLRTGLDDLSTVKMLDYGCGVKFTQAIIQYDIDVALYVGMDVYRAMIDYLTRHVNRPNMVYETVNFQNEKYHRKGVPMTKESPLPCGNLTFDLITLQSVFTHFTPEDFEALLTIFTRYLHPEGRLFFTCFIDNTMAVNFKDETPEKPLLRAVYREDFIRQVLKKTGWTPLSLHPKSYRMQSHFVCKLAEKRDT